MKNEVQKIISLLNRTFEKNAWYGPSITEVLTGITQDLAQKRLPHTHSIVELVNHMTSWRLFVIKKLEGDFHFKIDEQSNFPSDTDWNSSLEKLHTSQRQLLQLLDSFDPVALSEKVPHEGYQYSYFTLLHGIIHHDVYHLGQIALIKKTFTSGN